MVETKTPKAKAAPKKEDPKKAAPKKEAPKKEAPKKEAPKKEAPKKEAPKKEVAKKAAPKKDAPKKGAAAAPKKDVAKKEVVKKEKVKKVYVKKERKELPKKKVKDPLKKVKDGKVKKVRKPIKVGNVRYGVKKREIIRKIAKPRVKRTDGKVQKTPLYITKPIGGEKNGGTRTILVKKPPNYFPTEVKKRKRPAQKKSAPNHLKKSLKPGTLAIVLAGPHKGKRVIFLKQLQSGLCLVTGPFTLNRCPLRRINQIYLIGTSTKVNLTGDFEVPAHINDDYFRRIKLNNKKQKKEEGDIFNIKPKKYVVTDVKKVDQKAVDVVVLKAIKKRKDSRALCGYLASKFSLTTNQFPHELKF